MIANLYRAVVVASVATGLFVSTAAAQVVPDSLYNGVDRPFPARVEVPEDRRGEVVLKLLDAETGGVFAQASAAEGGVDLAALFPQLWQRRQYDLLYLQLYVEDEPVGTPVVLDAMVTPQTAVLNRGKAVFPNRGAGVYSGIRAYPDARVIMETTEGEIEIVLRPDHAPNTAYSFRHLVGGGFYEDILFHRIIGAREGRPPFVVQGGDPTGTGTGGPGYLIDLEPSGLPHDFGVISMARGSDPDSAGSQFFLCLSRDGTSFLDGNYTTFGYAISGADAIAALGSVETDAQDRPVQDVRLISARLVPAPPFVGQPEKVRDPSLSER